MARAGSGAKLGLCLALGLSLTLARCKAAPDAPANSKTRVRSAAGFPVSLRDDRGQSVAVIAAPQRIICLLPSFTETVFALGGGDRVVAVDDYSDYPPAARGLPKLGGLYDTQVERALALEPDLIFAAEGSTSLKAFARTGIPVWVGSPRTFEDVFRIITTVAQLIGRSDDGARLVASMRGKIAELEASVRGLPTVSVYYEIDPTPFSVGPASFIGVLLGKAGGKNIVPDGLGDFPKISPELILAADPDVILGASPEAIAQRPGFADLRALKQHRVWRWSAEESHLVSRPGPRLPEGLGALVRVLHATP